LVVVFVLGFGSPVFEDRPEVVALLVGFGVVWVTFGVGLASPWVGAYQAARRADQEAQPDVAPDRERSSRFQGSPLTANRRADDMASDEADDDVAQEWYERKSRLMEISLGKEHDMVMHAMIPYSIGGGLDLYYYPNGVPGTAIATKELSEAPNEGSSNRVYRSYELVMFTKHPLDLDAAKDETTDFGRAHMNINTILNYIAPYSAQATLNPNETCEFPGDMPRVGGKCLIFDGYASQSDDVAEDFGLLAVIEVFRSEMDYARENGGAALIELLKSEGHYPYSDLDREPVV
jgi:hypothetical protein